ncbi:MAG: hypothetical protein FWG45_01150 [Oscillospiraceae bacterium]|nr:hypothetical protein [Oscillospiraceae bacterium]
MDAISRAVGTIAQSPITKTNRENTDEMRNTLKREIAGVAENQPQIQGIQGEINTENKTHEMFSYLNNGTDLYGSNGSVAPQWGSGTFDDAAGESAEKVLQTTRENITARSQALATEIAFDKARGMDVSGNVAAMSNLSENLSVFDANTAFVPPAIDAKPAIAELAEQAGVDTSVVNPDQSEVSAFIDSGGSVTEQIAQAAQERDDGELSVAEQIAKDAKADHAKAGDIMNAQGGVDNIK